MDLNFVCFKNCLSPSNAGTAFAVLARHGSVWRHLLLCLYRQVIWYSRSISVDRAFGAESHIHNVQFGGFTLN